MVYSYIRVSTDKQDIESQKIGIIRKAKELKLTINEWISDEGVSGVKEYDKRNLGILMQKLNEGDVLIVSEISRLARSVFMLFRIVEFCNNKKIIIHSVKDSVSTVKPNDITSMMMLFCFGIAAQIERDMIIKRTNEGIERARREGVIIGRPVGAKSKKLKLTGKLEKIKKLIEKGYSKGAAAKMLGVHRFTVYRFLRDNNVKIGVLRDNNVMPNKAVIFLDSKKKNILSLAKGGLTHAEVMKKIQYKGSRQNFYHWWRKPQNKDIYKIFIAKNKEQRLKFNRRQYEQP